MSVGNVAAVFDAYRSDPATHETAFFRMLRRFCQSRAWVFGIGQEADDLMQEIAIKVLQSDLSRINQPESWLNTIITHTMIDMRRKHRECALPLDEAGNVLEFVPDDDPDIPSLPDGIQGRDREYCEHLLAGLTFDEIGERYGVTGDAIRKKLSRLGRKMSGKAVLKRSNS
jgi:DNA-directed RNA polymerase specialized sigma24 family protein